MRWQEGGGTITGGKHVSNRTVDAALVLCMKSTTTTTTTTTWGQLEKRGNVRVRDGTFHKKTVIHGNL